MLAEALAGATPSVLAGGRHRLQRRDFCGVCTTQWTASVLKERALPDGSANG